MATAEPRQESAPLSPVDVANQRFMVVKHGYETGEVEEYLRGASDELARLQGELTWLRGRAEHLECRGSTAEDAAYTRLANEFVAVMKAADEAGGHVLDGAEDEARTMLESAERRSTEMVSSADQRSKDMVATAEARSFDILGTAEARSAELLSSAQERATEMVSSAEARAVGLLADAERRAHALLADARPEAEEIGTAARRAAEAVIANWSRDASENVVTGPDEAEEATADESGERWQSHDGWAVQIWGEGAPRAARGVSGARRADDDADDLDLGPLFDLFGPDPS